ncbi:MAG: dihydroxy-acid dehydratase, partial [Acidiphilium sp. 21-68-69]
PAVHAERRRIAEASGKRIVELAKSGAPRPRDLITPASLRNALAVLQAIGGSTNGIIHLTAMAGRAGIRIELDTVDAIGRSVPVLVDLKPSGDHYMEHFHHAQTIGEIAEAAEIVPGQTVIRTADKPLKSSGALAVLRGNLCPRGAVIKQSAASPHLLNHTGPALVFENVEDMATRIDSDELDVTPETILVLRNTGPIGAPGMPEAGYLPIPRKLARAGVKDMVRISDARMSGTAFGTIVLHIAPESASGGPLALVRTGDPIRLDVAARTLDLLIDDAEWQRRAADHAARPMRPPPARGYARLFETTVLQADEGCDFDFLRGEGPSA